MKRFLLALILVSLSAGLATAGDQGKSASSAAPGAAAFKALVDTYWAVWGAGDLDKAAAMYAKEPDLVFYDLEPVKYVGWTAYRAGVVPNILSKFATAKFIVNDDLKATRRGSIAWTSVTVQGVGTLKAGGDVNVTMRHTAIWERRGNAWLIVHEHVSVPSSLPAAPPGK